MSKPRKTVKITSCPNPLFENWLMEWKDEAAAKGSNMQYCFAKALQSLRKYPVRLNSGKECLILQNFGTQLCIKLDRKLTEYRKEHPGHELAQATSRSENSSQSGHISDGVVSADKLVTKKKKRSKKNSIDQKAADSPSTKKIGKVVPKKVSKEYVPAYRSGPYAILLTLFESSQRPNYKGYMSKKELISDAQHLCDSSFTKPETSGSRYTAWSSVSILIKKGTVARDSCPAKYSLTQTGIEVAQKLMKSVASSQMASGDLANNHAQFDKIDFTEDYLPSLKASSSNSTNSGKGSPSNFSRDSIGSSQNKISNFENVSGNSLEDCPRISDAWGSSNGEYENSPINCKNYNSHEDEWQRLDDFNDRFGNDLEKSEASSNILYTKSNVNLEKYNSRDINRSPDFWDNHRPDSWEDHCTDSRNDHRLDSWEDHCTDSRNDHRLDSWEDHCTNPRNDYRLDTWEDHCTNPRNDHRLDSWEDHCTNPRNDHRPDSWEDHHIGFWDDRYADSQNNQIIENENFTQSSSQSQKFAISETCEEQWILMPDEFDIILLVDVQETTGGSKNSSKDVLVSELTRLGTKYEVRHLKVGDFTWICRHRLDATKELMLPYIAERKRIDDLAHSIKDGRFHEQKFRLRQCGLDNVIYLVENLEGCSSTTFGLPMSTVQQAAANTQLIDGFHVQFTRNQRHSVAYLHTLTKHIAKSFRDKTLVSCPKSNLVKVNLNEDLVSLLTFREFAKSSNKTKNFKVREMFMKQLMQLKGMSGEKAAAVVDKYPTPRSLIEAFACGGDKLLANIQFGPLKRNIGPVISSALYALYTNETLR